MFDKLSNAAAVADLYNKRKIKIEEDAARERGEHVQKKEENSIFTLQNLSMGLKAVGFVASLASLAASASNKDNKEKETRSRNRR